MGKLHESMVRILLCAVLIVDARHRIQRHRKDQINRSLDLKNSTLRQNDTSENFAAGNNTLLSNFTEVLLTQNRSEVAANKRIINVMPMKKQVVKDQPGASAIVVIGNRTHKVTGPVVKELLMELQRQASSALISEPNKFQEPTGQLESVLLGEKAKAPDLEYSSTHPVTSSLTEASAGGQAGILGGANQQRPSNHLRKGSAAIEVAEINKILGKPLTDAKALGLIKNLLLDKVHLHLAQSMDAGDGLGDAVNPAGPAALVDQKYAQTQWLPNPEAASISLQRESCKDIDPKDKCGYIRQLGLCSAGKLTKSVRKRCADSCGLCDCMTECGGMCGPCQQFIIPAPPPPAPPPAPVYYYPAPPPPPPPPLPLPLPLPPPPPPPPFLSYPVHGIPAMPYKPALPACRPECIRPVNEDAPLHCSTPCVPQPAPPPVNYEDELFECKPCHQHPCLSPTCRPVTATMTRPFSSPCYPHSTPTTGQVLCPPALTTPLPTFYPPSATLPKRVQFIEKHVTQLEGYTTPNEASAFPGLGTPLLGSPGTLARLAALVSSGLGSNGLNGLRGGGAQTGLNPNGLNGLPGAGTQVNPLTGEITSTNPLTGATSRINPLTGEVTTSVGVASGVGARVNPLTGEVTPGIGSAGLAGAGPRINPLTGQVVPGINPLLGTGARVNPVTGEVIPGMSALASSLASAIAAGGPVAASQSSSAAAINPVTGALSPVVPGIPGGVNGMDQTTSALNAGLAAGLSGLNPLSIAGSMAANQLLNAQGAQLLPLTLQRLQAQMPVNLPRDGRCRIPADIVLALDSSEATVPHWAQIQHFARQFMDHIVMAGNTRIGILQYDSIAKVIVSLEQLSNVPDVKMQINSMVPDPFGKRRTDDALEAARTKLFATARPNVPKVLILLEHGKIVVGDPSVDGMKLLAEAAQRVHAAGIETFVIGTTPAATDQDMQIIATGGDSQHIFKLTSYQELEQTVPLLLSRICGLPEKYDATAAANISPEKPKPTPAVEVDIPEITLTQLRKALYPNSMNVDGPITRSQPGPFGCAVNYAKIGCYNDDQNNPRPIPKVLFTDRGSQYPEFSGKEIDWNHWSTYLPDLICRCALATRKEGFKVFGVQSFGTCLSGMNAQETYAVDGEADADMCVDRDAQRCTATDKVCVGKQETNFVYTLDADDKRSKIPGNTRVSVPLKAIPVAGSNSR